MVRKIYGIILISIMYFLNQAFKLLLPIYDILKFQYFLQTILLILNLSLPQYIISKFDFDFKILILFFLWQDSFGKQLFCNCKFICIHYVYKLKRPILYKYFINQINSCIHVERFIGQICYWWIMNTVWPINQIDILSSTWEMLGHS
jgi:hypothetical protein